MTKLYEEMDKDEKVSCREKIAFLASIGFTELSDQPTPRIVHEKLPNETFDVHDLNPLALVKRIYDLGEDVVNEIIKTHGPLNDSGKCCSVCGNWFKSDEFVYGGRENRSYCRPCNKMARDEYRIGGVEAARKFRSDTRATWKKSK